MQKGLITLVKLKKPILNHNYENVAVEDMYFSSCCHMKDLGARKFTTVILKDFF